MAYLVYLIKKSNYFWPFAADPLGEFQKMPAARADVSFPIGRLFRNALAGCVLSLSLVAPAHAIELHWGGQFWSEFNLVSNYNLDSATGTVDATRAAAGGYYISPAGNNDANWETLFMRLRPKLIVNDNVYIKSEFWLGDPIFGVFGNAPGWSSGQNQFYSNQSRGSAISAQRFWAEFISDFGIIQVGRAPSHWGLGVVWNSGDGLFDRYQTTGDTLRIISNFSAITVMPSFISYSSGNTIGGSCPGFGGTGVCTPGSFAGSVNEYSLALKYENDDEDMEIGFNLIKRLAGGDQTTHSGPYGASVASGGAMNYNIYDIFAKKRVGRFGFGAELPIVSGTLTGTNLQSISYRSFAAAVEADWRASDTWELRLKGGHASGQPNSDSTNAGSFRGFFFNPNYKLGMIMFNYQLANFGRANIPAETATTQNLRSPYDNPITNATYIGATALAHVDKWDFRGSFVWAKASIACDSGTVCYNSWSRSEFTRAGAAPAQGTSLGWEMDYGLTFNWDDNFKFMGDFGFFFPGEFYKFSNTATENATDTVFAASAKVGVTF